MNDCVNAEVRDALPDLLAGRLGALDQATMKAHVDSCADCRGELELLRSIRAAAPLAPRMNVDRIASAIPAFALPQRARRSHLWRVAAAAVVVTAGGVMLSSRDKEPAPVASVPSVATPAPAVTPSPDASSGAAQQAAPREVELAALSLVGSTADLTDADLEQLVSDLEGIDALPAAEPSSVSLENIGTEDDQ